MAKEMIKFSQMKFEQLDLKEIELKFNKIINEFENAKSFEQQDKVLMKLNKFSDYLPGMSDGRLGSMEISQSSVSYEIRDVSPKIYDNYVNELLEQGYTMSSEGVFVKDSYQITTTINDDGKMIIDLITI